jgi:hypothetical protein
MFKFNSKKKVISAGILAVACFVASTGTSFAHYGEQLEKEILKTGVKYGTPEYYAFTEMWSNYYLDLLPDSSQTEALQRLTVLPEYGDLDGWREYFSDGDPIKLRDEAYRVAKELGVDGQNLSQKEKIKRITDWDRSGRSPDSLLKVAGTIDGANYDCTTSSEGRMTLYRIAGIPAVSVPMTKQVLHEEPFFFDGGSWVPPLADRTFSTFFKNVSALLITGPITMDYEQIYQLKGDIMLDINESWIDKPAEQFMLKLLCQPYAYPHQKLTRGEVAKMICNYLGVVPMVNEMMFVDVPTSHRYAPYVWAVNKIGIMTGDNGEFRPESELSMQEFAVIAERMIGWGKARAEMKLDNLAEELPTWEYYKDYTKAEIDEIFQNYRDRVASFNLPSGRTAKVFADGNQIAAWAKPAVDVLSSWGILEGDSAGTGANLHPKEMMSKTRFLVFLYKFEQRLTLRSQFGGAQFSSNLL